MKRRQFTTLVLGSGALLLVPRSFARNPRGTATGVGGGGGGGGITFDRFIAPNGDDNNDGLTPATAWSITALNSKQAIYSGKKVGIIGDVGGTQTPIQYGTVNGVQTTLFSLLSSGVTALNTNGGTAASRTVIASCNSSGVYTRGWAIIDPSNPAGGAHPSTDSINLMGWSKFGTLPPHADYITFDGLTLRNFCYSGICLACSSTASNITIQNCEFYGVTTAATGNNPGAIRFDATSGAQVLNCKFHDCVASSGTFAPAYSGVFSYNSTALTVTSCTFYNIGASVQQKDANQDAVISYCYMDYGSFGVVTGNPYGCYYEGMTGAGRTTTIHHCIMLGPMYLQGGSPTNFSGDYEFYNNTMDVVNLSNPLFYWQQPNSGGTFHAFNNVFYEQGGSWTGGSQYGVGKFTGANGTTLPQWDYNYYLTAPQFCPSGNGGVLVSFASWQALGFDAHSHTGGSPFSGTPTAQTPSSFALNPASAANTGGIGGVTCGALDGSGTVGCNF